MIDWSTNGADPRADIELARERAKAETGLDNTLIVVMLTRPHWEFFLSRGLIDEEGWTQGSLREEFGHVRCVLVESLAITVGDGE